MSGAAAITKCEPASSGHALVPPDLTPEDVWYLESLLSADAAGEEYQQYLTPAKSKAMEVMSSDPVFSVYGPDTFFVHYDGKLTTVKDIILAQQVIQ